MAERFPIESLKVVGNNVYRVAPDGQMLFVRSLAEDPTANTDVFAAPPRADAPSFYAATPEPDSYFGQQAVGMAAPYLENARNLALSANTMTPDRDSYVPESIQRMGNYAKNMGLAGLSAAMAPVYGAAGAVGDVAKAAGVPRSEALTRDLGAMLDTAGILPEGRILSAMADAGAVSQVAGNAKRAVNAAVEKAPVVYADAIGNARALAQGDLEFMRGRGLPSESAAAGAQVTGQGTGAGTIAPHGDRYNEYNMILAGTKPAVTLNPTVFDELYKADADRLGLEVRPYTIPGFGDEVFHVVAQPGEGARADRIVDLIKKKNTQDSSGVGPEYHRELGRLLGYSEADINLFIGNSSGTPGMGDNGGPPLIDPTLDIFEETPSAPAPRPRYVDPTTGRYSKAFEAAQDLTQNIMTPEQARAGLIKQGVPEEELLYTGFDNWLKGKDKVTKQEIVDILSDVAINKSGQGSLPFSRITHEGTGITGGGGDQQLLDLRDQVMQDRRATTAQFVDDYATTLRNDLEGQGFQRINTVEHPEDLQNLQAMIAEADSKGLYVDPTFRYRAENVQEYVNRDNDFYSNSARRSRLMLNQSTADIYRAPDGSLLSENTAFEYQFPDHQLPDEMRQQMEYELTNSVERMDEQQIADYLGLDVNDLQPTFDPGTTQYAGYGPKGLMDYRENRYGYDDLGRGVISGSESERGTRSYREGHFSKGSEDENRLYHTRVGMLNTPEGKAYHAFELQSDVGQSYRNDPSQFHVTGTSPTFEIPKASKKALQEYVTVGKKYEDLMSQQRVAEEVLYSDKYLDMNTGRFKKDEEGYEELSSHVRDIREKLRPLSTKLTELATNNQVLDDMQRFYGRPDMSMLYGDALDIKAIEEALAGTLTPKPGAPGSTQGKISTRPFTTSTNRWVPAALKDELFNAANSDAEWFSLPLGKDVESWTYGESAGQGDFYENIVPTQLKKLLKKEYGLDVPIEKIKAEGFLKRDNPTYEVNAIRLTPELRKMILGQGFSTFKEGGPVVGSSLSDVDVFALP